MRSLKWGLYISLGVAVFVGLSLLQGAGTAEKEVLIPRGAFGGKVAALLVEEGVISSPFLFKALVYATGGSRTLKAGEYSFKTGMGPMNAVMVLYFSSPIEHVVTVPEGWTGRQIAEILAAQKLVDVRKFADLVYSRRSASKYKIEAASLEGFLFPDTYTFSRIDGEQRIVDRLVQRFFAKVDKGLIHSAKTMGLSLEKLVTLASIIEKETGASNERELISSVFHNRLKKKMRLQSDPTTIYGIQNFNGNLTRRDLLTPTPYNTYTIPGLPPGPIASPGLAALKAAVHPADTGFLYFVSNNRGGHLFSESYAKHSGLVDQYQKRGAARRQADSTRQLGTAGK